MTDSPISSNRKAEVCWSCNGTRLQPSEPSGEEPCPFCSDSDTPEQLRTEIARLRAILEDRDADGRVAKALAQENVVLRAALTEVRDDVEKLRAALTEAAEALRCASLGDSLASSRFAAEQARQALDTGQRHRETEE